MIKRIPIVSGDRGADKGRKIVFDTYINEIAVLRVDKLQKEGWYPFNIDPYI